MQTARIDAKNLSDPYIIAQGSPSPQSIYLSLIFRDMVSQGSSRPSFANESSNPIPLVARPRQLSPAHIRGTDREPDPELAHSSLARKNVRRTPDEYGGIDRGHILYFAFSAVAFYGFAWTQRLVYCASCDSKSQT